MALPGFVYFDSTMPGAPAIAGSTAGSYNDLCNWIIGLVGGTRTHHDASTNQSVFQWPGGHQQSFWVCQDAAISGSNQRAAIRACESATGYTYADLVNPYPNQSQVSDTSSNHLVSTVNNATARAYAGIAWEGGMVITIQVDGTWWLPPMHLGDLIPTDPSDLWCSGIAVRNATSNINSQSPASHGGASGWDGTNCYFFRRSIDGSVVSTTASHGATTGSSGLGYMSPGPSMSAGYNGDILHRPLQLNCAGSTTTTVNNSTGRFGRAAVPNIRVPVHSGIGSYTHLSVIPDSAYSPGALLVPYYMSAGGNGSMLEITDTWRGDA